MSERDELALELFIGDNFNQPRESSIQDWEYFHAEHRFLGRTEHYKAMAEHVLAAGYSKPRPPTAESVDAAAQAVYAITPSSQSIAWELLPRIVQHEVRTMALTAINAANAATS